MHFALEGGMQQWSIWLGVLFIGGMQVLYLDREAVAYHKAYHRDTLMYHQSIGRDWSGMDCLAHPHVRPLTPAPDLLAVHGPYMSFSWPTERPFPANIHRVLGAHSALLEVF